MAFFQENTVFIDRGKSKIRGLLVRRGMGTFDVIKKESLPALSGEEEGSGEEYNLLRFIHTLFPEEAAFALCVNPDEAYTRSVDVPAADPALALEILPGDLEALLPVPLEDVEIVASPWQTGAESTRMIAFAVEGKHLSHLADPFVRSGKTLVLITPAAQALACALRFLPAQDYAGRVVGQIHIGYESTIFNLLLDGKLVFSRNLSIGGRSFTLEIAEEAGKDEDWAEQFKIDSGLDISRVEGDEPGAGSFSRSGFSAARLKRLKKSLSDVALELSRDIERTILASPVREPVHIYVSGGGSQLRGLIDILEEQLNLRLHRYPLQLGEENVDEWVLCLGAVQAAGLGRKERMDFLQTPGGSQLRSGEVRLRRFAAPAILAGAAVLVFFLSFSLSALLEQQDLKKAREELQKVAQGIAGVNPGKDPVAEARSLCQNRLRIMRSVLGGYRTLDVLKDITEHTAGPETATLQLKSIRYSESDVEIDLQVDSIQQTNPIQEHFQNSALVSSVEVVRRDLLPAQNQKVRLTLKLVLKPPQTGLEVDCR